MACFRSKGQTELVIVERDGENEVVIDRYAFANSTPTWAPDGTRILAPIEGGEPGPGFAIVDLGDAARDVVLHAHEVAGDGSWQRLDA